MSVFEFPSNCDTADEIIAQKLQVQKYIRTAADPNEIGSNGRTLLQLALVCCFEGAGESDVSDLLDRGADPNKPTAWANFTALLLASNSIALVKKFIETGLRLNDVYDIDPETGGMTIGPATLLDHAYAIRDYISPKRKKVNALANKYAGGLGKRRRFIDETIALLESSGAKRAADLKPS